jgi:murein DD-endopeptidase MepM/ murein hydrolase activator NlpD
MSAKWPWYVAGAAGFGLGTALIVKWFVEKDAWEQSVTEPDSSREEFSAMTTSSMLAWPVKGLVRSPYGTRVNPITKVPGQFHNGIDIAAPEGTQVLAPADGTVKAIWEDVNYGGGYSMVITHDGQWSGLQTGYAHLSKWLVAAGQKVRKGDVLALTGGVPNHPGAGMSTGAHLHLTVRRNGVVVDPVGELEPVPGVSPNIA